MTTLSPADFDVARRKRPARRCGNIILLLAALVSVGCQKAEKRPEPVVERFLHAMNDKDVNVMLTCIDPRQERMFRASFRLVEKFTGGRLPVEDLLELLPGLYQLFRDKVAADVRVGQFQVYRAKLTGQDGEVPVWLTEIRRAADEQKDTECRLLFRVRQFDEGWRIVGIERH